MNAATARPSNGSARVVRASTGLLWLALAGCQVSLADRLPPGGLADETAPSAAPTADSPWLSDAAGQPPGAPASSDRPSPTPPPPDSPWLSDATSGPRSTAAREPGPSRPVGSAPDLGGPPTGPLATGPLDRAPQDLPEVPAPARPVPSISLPDGAPPAAPPSSAGAASGDPDGTSPPSPAPGPGPVPPDDDQPWLPGAVTPEAAPPAGEREPPRPTSTPPPGEPRPAAPQPPAGASPAAPTAPEPDPWLPGAGTAPAPSEPQPAPTETAGATSEASPWLPGAGTAPSPAAPAPSPTPPAGASEPDPWTDDDPWTEAAGRATERPTPTASAPPPAPTRIRPDPGPEAPTPAPTARRDTRPPLVATTPTGRALEQATRLMDDPGNPLLAGYPEDVLPLASPSAALADGERPLVLLFYDNASRDSDLLAADLLPVLAVYARRVDIVAIDRGPDAALGPDEARVASTYMGDAREAPVTVVAGPERTSLLLIRFGRFSAAALEAVLARATGTETPPDAVPDRPETPSEMPEDVAPGERETDFTFSKPALDRAVQHAKRLREDPGRGDRVGYPTELVPRATAATALEPGTRPVVIVFYDDASRASDLQAADVLPVLVRAGDAVDVVLVDMNPDAQRTEAERKLVRPYYPGSVPATVVLSARRSPVKLWFQRTSGKALEAAIREAARRR